LYPANIIRIIGSKQPGGDI